LLLFNAQTMRKETNQRKEQHNGSFIPNSLFSFLYQHVHVHVSTEALLCGWYPRKLIIHNQRYRSSDSNKMQKRNLVWTTRFWSNLYHVRSKPNYLYTKYFKIIVREHQRNNEEWTIYRNWQYLRRVNLYANKHKQHK
jgi:hypothetical protein